MNKKQAIQSAKDANRRTGKTRTMSIYRICGQWMYTSKTKEETQAQYQNQIKDWQTVAAKDELAVWDSWFD